MKLTVGVLKGGASRTTTAVCLGLSLHWMTGGSVLIVDADPANGTAFEWVEDARSAAGWPDGVDVAYWPISSLAKKVSSVRVDHVVIDTGNDASALRSALEVTDHLVVPLAPTGTESTRLTPTLTAAAEVAQRKPVELSILLTRVRRTRSRESCREALENELGLRVLRSEIPMLERFAALYGTAPQLGDLSPYDAAAAELMEIEKGNW